LNPLLYTIPVVKVFLNPLLYTIPVVKVFLNPLLYTIPVVKVFHRSQILFGNALPRSFASLRNLGFNLTTALSTY
ncbi:hypothetical protein, partial [Candidatus Parabeggiatoa sp. HSG14]|uniref:hypothetical protein n=1 Tax=Candidatus Parabeggiatoa sp. HSG14 TaxID=3055593 RepID=UPI0025A8040D|nr:hypothetical protein [Thiotrichales bacterium HSG14]